jgi:hypothetical protein
MGARCSDPDHLATPSARFSEMNASTIKRRIVAAIAFAGFLSASAVHADSVFRCKATDGATSFQDRPCADARAQSIVEIAPAPPPQASPDYGVASERATPRVSKQRMGKAAPREPMSYACHASDGELFYRHGPCPSQIASANAPSHGRGAKASERIGVTAEAMPRSEVCRRLASAGSIGRAGHEHDESISSYDRNLGRDPCRDL